MKINCDFNINKDCEQELKSLGGLMFSPPKNINGQDNFTKKYHICKYCYAEITNIRVFNKKLLSDGE